MSEPTFDSRGPGVTEHDCSFCRRKFWIDVPNLRLAHEAPHCAEFEVMDVITFMRENRLIKERALAERKPS